MASKIITIEDSRFIYATNFSGDPDNDKYRSSERKGNLVIPDIVQAKQMIDEGFNIRFTKPREDEEEGFVPTYYVAIRVNFNSKYPPKVYLVSGDSEPVLLDEESIAIIDNMRIHNVNAVLNSHEYGEGQTLYVKTMYVEQAVDDDPFAERYARNRISRSEDVPF